MPTYQIAGHHITSEQFADEAVVLNLHTGQYFGLNGPARAYWERIISGVSLRVSFASPDETTRAEAFVQTLIEYGLIVPTEAATASVSEQAVIAGEPVIDVYDDLADLILADPIHDVDASAGWPVQSTQ